MSSRTAVTMSEDEVRAFLEEPRTMALASHTADGDIHQVGMWFGLQGDALVMTAFHRSQKVVNLRRDPRFSGLIEDGSGYADLRGVNLRGHAEVLTESDRVLDIVRMVTVRYGGQMPASATRAAAGRVAIILRPHHVTSWDHRKLAGGY
ncbi:pyridoxamine 5'-phosphate oxidase family protein [Pseudonocardia spinosispora]|uniref:pyridoxamine 5'-phosphate oxidase family protein n=1 Tax=Pseudonocardia spinosispora TaxID=103441 RepID=UPI00048BEC8C|nr:pyridoxamine 5'-phosphate oxidase family protein [Pseudonocardia spinosispora]